MLGFLKNLRKSKKSNSKPEQERKEISYEELLTNKKYGDLLYLGVYTDNIRGDIHVPINFQDRFRHMVIFGGTGMGKSTLLVNMIVQDMHAGHGLCFIDPKGDAIEEVLMRVPEHRTDDVILIDPANYDKVVGLNFLELPKKNLSDAQLNAIKEVIVSDLVALMKQQTRIWGERFGRIFETLIRAILDFNERASEEDQLTFLDLYVLLTDEEIRNKFAESVRDPIIRGYLLKINEMKEDVMEPVIRRLNDWIMNKVARQIVAHRKSSFDFREAIDSGKIILVRIPKGEVGEAIMQLVGLTVISKIWAAAKSRVDTPPEERVPFFLYVDEFANFAFEGSTFDEILSEARAFKLGLILATQYPSQLSHEVREAVYGNCGTIITFNPQNPNDAKVLIKRFPGVKDEDLLSLGLYTVMLRITVRNELSDPFIIRTYPPTTPIRSRSEINRVIERSLSLYGRERISEMDLSASLKRIKEMSRFSLKDGFVDEMAEVLYNLVIKGLELNYRNFAEEARRRAISVTEQQYANLLEIFDRMDLIELRSELVKGKYTANPKPDKIKSCFWDGKFNTILAGLIDHRKLVERVYEFFTQLGFVVEVPVARDAYMPDLLLKYPAAMNYQEMDKVYREMNKSGAWQLTRGREAAVEIETTTHTHPGQLLMKLKKAYSSGRVAIFVVMGSGTTVKEYTSTARQILQILTDMRGRSGFYTTDEPERDRRGRKLWMNKHSGEIAYESNGMLFNVKTNELECTVREAKDKGWTVKKMVFDPYKEFGEVMPEQGRDFIVLIFPPDDFDFPVVQVIRAGTGFKLIPVRRSDSEFWRRIMGEETAGGKELTAALEYALKKYLKGEKVSDSIKREIDEDKLEELRRIFQDEDDEEWS